jgi:hypothetical protein
VKRTLIHWGVLVGLGLVAAFGCTADIKTTTEPPRTTLTTPVEPMPSPTVEPVDLVPGLSLVEFEVAMLPQLWDPAVNCPDPILFDAIGFDAVLALGVESFEEGYEQALTPEGRAEFERLLGECPQ